jgi:hypothetical protein
VPVTKINSNWINNFNGRSETTRRNLREMLEDTEMPNDL